MLPPFQVPKSTFNQPMKLKFEWYYPACYLLNYTYVKISKWTIPIKIKMKIGWSGKKAYDENSSEYSLLSDIRLIGEPVIAKRYCYVLHHFPLYFPLFAHEEPFHTYTLAYSLDDVFDSSIAGRCSQRRRTGLLRPNNLGNKYFEKGHFRSRPFFPGHPRSYIEILYR